jgi:hypothetical protein
MPFLRSGRPIERIRGEDAMSTNTGALRATTGISTRVAVGIAAAVIAAVTTVVLWATFTGTDAQPTTATLTESVGSVPRTGDRPTGLEATTDRISVGGEGPARFHPLP